ncbi:MAG: hypothetical protein JSV86_18380 [Gemmatimonadota bacterium]|nr:MAG: hypothetical protein JSV86_18380 [Gemmatimonadota bacterium]
MRNITGSIALYWIAVTVAACAGTSENEIQVEPAMAPAPRDSIYVRVINAHFYDARVFALYEGGERHPLGLVVGHTESQLIPILWQPRRLEFEISFIAETGLYLSDDLSLEPGDVVHLTIPPNIATSAFFHRVR